MAPRQQTRQVLVSMRWPTTGEDLLLNRSRVGPLLRVRLAAEVVWTYLEVRRLMGRHNIVEVVRILRAGADDRLEPDTALRLANRLGRPVWRTLSALPADSRCLVRSLIVLRMMARRGVCCRLLLGARPGCDFEAHAWIEHNGEAVLPTLGYAPLATI